ncbi:MAG: N-acetyltransferase, partial [Candidatus Dormiibacterota bacterium]
AVLHFGFACLGGQVALSAAFSDNQASLAVSRSLGYEENGVLVVERRGIRAEQVGLRLTRVRWESTTRPAVHVEGVESSLELFGV